MFFNFYGFNLFRTLGELMGCVQSRELSACAPLLPSFILLGSFSDTLLAVLILDWGQPFQGCGGAYGLCPESRGRACLAFQGLSCLEASVTLCLWFRFQTQSMIAICSQFCSPKGINSTCYVFVMHYIYVFQIDINEGLIMHDQHTLLDF